MTDTYTYSNTISFTITHAKHMAAKVATDLKRLQRFYGVPSDTNIADYEQEVVALLRDGYLGTVTYGFRRNDNWIVPTLQYTARDLAMSSVNDDDPGRVRPGANIANATFHSYLTYSSAWDRLSAAQQDAYKKALPFYRKGAPEPSPNGYFSADRTYSSGGRALDRASLRSY